MCKTPKVRALCATSRETERPTGDGWKPLAKACGRCHELLHLRKKRGAGIPAPPLILTRGSTPKMLYNGYSTFIETSLRIRVHFRFFLLQ